MFNRGARPSEPRAKTQPPGTGLRVVVVEADGDITERLVVTCPEFDLDQVNHVDDAIKGALGPTIVVLGPDASNSATLDRVEELRDLCPSSELTVVVAVSKINTALLRRALRAGISDVVDLNEAGDLEGALRRVASRAAQRLVSTSASGRRGRVIAVFSPKGGVGTTSVAINIAARRGSVPNV
ncbi:MAG: pilus assembly protein CpaE, partial [Actinomycetota bacterium]